MPVKPGMTAAGPVEDHDGRPRRKVSRSGPAEGPRKKVQRGARQKITAEVPAEGHAEGGRRKARRKTTTKDHDGRSRGAARRRVQRKARRRVTPEGQGGRPGESLAEGLGRRHGGAPRRRSCGAPGRSSNRRARGGAGGGVLKSFVEKFGNIWKKVENYLYLCSTHH